jgi:hypothetical protein
VAYCASALRNSVGSTAALLAEVEDLACTA